LKQVTITFRPFPKTLAYIKLPINFLLFWKKKGHNTHCKVNNWAFPEPVETSHEYKQYFFTVHFNNIPDSIQDTAAWQVTKLEIPNVV
jgi:hypothetical protein